MENTHQTHDPKRLAKRVEELIQTNQFSIDRTRESSPSQRMALSMVLQDVLNDPLMELITYTPNVYHELGKMLTEVVETSKKNADNISTFSAERLAKFWPAFVFELEHALRRVKKEIGVVPFAIEAWLVAIDESRKENGERK